MVNYFPIDEKERCYRGRLFQIYVCRLVTGQKKRKDSHSSPSSRRIRTRGTQRYLPAASLGTVLKQGFIIKTTLHFRYRPVGAL